MEKVFFECGQGMKNFATDKLAQQTARANENAQFIIYTAGCDPETLFEHARIFRYSDFMYYGEKMKLFSANGHIKAYEFPLWNGVMYRSSEWYNIINKPNSHAAGRGSYVRMSQFLEMGLPLKAFLEMCGQSVNFRSLSIRRFVNAFDHSEQMRIENFSSDSLKSGGILGDIFENSCRLLFADWLVYDDETEIDNLLYGKVHQGANEHDIALEFTDTEYAELMAMFADNGVI